MNIPRKQRIIPLKELRADPDGVAKRVRDGEVLIVLKRSRPLFRLIKPYEDEPTNRNKESKLKR